MHKPAPVKQQEWLSGRGNPNWTATTPREAFFLLDQFALTETRTGMDLLLRSNLTHQTTYAAAGRIVEDRDVNEIQRIFGED